MAAFDALYSISTPGRIVDLPYKWKREKQSLYEEAKTGRPGGKQGKLLIDLR